MESEGKGIKGKEMEWLERKDREWTGKKRLESDGNKREVKRFGRTVRRGAEGRQDKGERMKKI